jgi:hypothetical protein
MIAAYLILLLVKHDYAHSNASSLLCSGTLIFQIDRNLRQPVLL